WHTFHVIDQVDVRRHESMEWDVKELQIFQYVVMVALDPGGARLGIQAICEVPQGVNPASRPITSLKHNDSITSFVQFVRCGEASKTSPEYKNGSLRCADFCRHSFSSDPVLTPTNFT